MRRGVPDMLSVRITSSFTAPTSLEKIYVLAAKTIFGPPSVEAMFDRNWPIRLLSCPSEDCKKRSHIMELKRNWSQRMLTPEFKKLSAVTLEFVHFVRDNRDQPLTLGTKVAHDIRKKDQS